MCDRRGTPPGRAALAASPARHVPSFAFAARSTVRPEGTELVPPSLQRTRAAIDVGAPPRIQRSRSAQIGATPSSGQARRALPEGAEPLLSGRISPDVQSISVKRRPEHLHLSARRRLLRFADMLEYARGYERGQNRDDHDDYEHFYKSECDAHVATPTRMTTPHGAAGSRRVCDAPVTPILQSLALHRSVPAESICARTKAITACHLHRWCQHLDESPPRAMSHTSTKLTLLPSEGPFAAAIDTLLRYAPFPCHLVLLGESGVGKTTLARLVHERSRVANGPFETVNLAGLDDDLANSELMGHERGAFTGAYGRHLGAFERSHGGTLFLDEVGKLSIPIQKKILTVIDDGLVRRVGGQRDIPVRVRHIFAANESLETLVHEGKLLPEFEARLQFQRIRVPSLRERREEIPMLFADLLRRHAPQYGYPARPPIATDPLVERLQSMRWPGNVRSLENLAIRLLQDASGSQTLGPELFTTDLEGYCGGTLFSATPTVSRRDRIVGALREASGNVTRAAELLGCSRSTIYLWMREDSIAADACPDRTA